MTTAYFDPANHVHVGRAERLLSLIAGAALVTNAVARRSPLAAVLAVAGLPLLHRGITGHCLVSEAFTRRIRHRTLPPQSSTEHSTENFQPGAEDIVTESSMESFPASDPPSGW